MKRKGEIEMKKFLKLLIALILALVVIGGITFLIDSSRIASGKDPICSIQTGKLKDGGTTTYLGIGYKIIDFHMINGYDETKIGSWFMKSSDFKEEYENYQNRWDENSFEETPLIQEEPSGDEIIENPDENSIEQIEEPIDNIEEPLEENPDENIELSIEGEMGEEPNIENPIEDEVNLGENVEELPLEEQATLSFVATIMGVSQNSIIVTADEGEDVRASSDMFTFSNPDPSNTYTTGQKIRVFYTGDIMETYPAQITATSLEVVE